MRSKKQLTDIKDNFRVHCRIRGKVNILFLILWIISEKLIRYRVDVPDESWWIHEFSDEMGEYINVNKKAF